MKTIFPLACAALCTFVSSALSFDELAVYKAENIDDSGGKMIWNDPVGGNNLENKDTLGITIGDKPEVGNDAKSVVFSGEQTSPFCTLAPYLSVPTDALKVSVAFKPGSAGGESGRTLLRQGNWEMSYSPKSEEIGLTVWHETNAYSSVSARIQPDVWQEVTATFEEGTLTIQVNGEIQTRPAKSAKMLSSPSTGLLIGAASGGRKGSAPDRPFSGSLADIHISGK